MIDCGSLGLLGQGRDDRRLRVGLGWSPEMAGRQLSDLTCHSGPQPLNDRYPSSPARHPRRASCRSSTEAASIGPCVRFGDLRRFPSRHTRRLGARSWKLAFWFGSHSRIRSMIRSSTLASMPWPSVRKRSRLADVPRVCSCASASSLKRTGITGSASPCMR